jgi:hypothetical protein
MAVVARDGFTFVPAALMILRPIALRIAKGQKGGLDSAMGNAKTSAISGPPPSLCRPRRAEA